METNTFRILPICLLFISGSMGMSAQKDTLALPKNWDKNAELTAIHQNVQNKEIIQNDKNGLIWHAQCNGKNYYALHNKSGFMKELSCSLPSNLQGFECTDVIKDEWFGLADKDLKVLVR